MLWWVPLCITVFCTVHDPVGALYAADQSATAE